MDNSLFDWIECELTQILMMTDNPANLQVIVLQEKGGKRSFLVHIGLFEAMAINRYVNGEETPRPMTHDLALNLVERLGGVILRVAVSDLIEDINGNGTYHGLMTVGREGEEIEIDCRPSDAVALAVRCGCPIYVSRHILERVSDGQ